MFFKLLLHDHIAQQLIKLHPLPIVNSFYSLKPAGIPGVAFTTSTHPQIYYSDSNNYFSSSPVINLCNQNYKNSTGYPYKLETKNKKKLKTGKTFFGNKSNIFDQMAAVNINNNLGENGTEIPEVVDNMDTFYILVDIGANLTNKKFSRDVDSVVQRAKEAGVLKIMVTGSNILVSKEALRLTRLFPDVLFATAGIHPHDAKTFDEHSISEIEGLCSHPEVVALGECGLDFNRNFSPPEMQLEVFEKQVQLACRLKKPLFLHERDAFDEMISVLKKYQDKLPPSVLHCFTGTVSQVKAYLDIGLYIGITGYVWKDKSEDGVRKMLIDNVVPLDRLMIETDAPFMYPNTRSAKLTADMKEVMTQRSLNYLNRNCTFQRNEPCSLPATLEMISALMKKQPEEVAMATTYNAVKIFGLSS